MKHVKPVPASASLIERAAEVYDFGGVFKGAAKTSAPEITVDAAPTPPIAPVLAPVSSVTTKVGEHSVATLDVAMLREAGFIEPGTAPSILSEEFRLVKRQLMMTAFGGRSAEPLERGRAILVCSAQPNEGKTFCSVNLALSFASERDVEILLVDADVAKPEILSTLGIEGGPGLMDAIADPSIDVESLIIPTSIPTLSVLSAGRQTNCDTELLASARTQIVIESMLASKPSRIIIFDTAPVLAASPAAVLAQHVGQILMIVRADRTGESELREAVSLLDGCEHIQLLLNGASFGGAHQKFGSYYGYGG